MERYIDADVLYVNIKAECNPYGEPTINFDDGCKVLDMIRRTPTADVEPVIHARWVRKRMLTHDGELYCSNCEWTPEVIAVGGTTVHDLQLADVYRCPHCGAKMDEEVE